MRVALVAMMLVSCGVDRVVEPEPAGASCTFWEPRLLEIAPAKTCVIGWDPGWTVYPTGNASPVDEYRALAGPVTVRYDADAGAYLPVVLLMSPEGGECSVMDCESQPE